VRNLDWFSSSVFSAQLSIAEPSGFGGSDPINSNKLNQNQILKILTLIDSAHDSPPDGQRSEAFV
jgi:hypothetical protein